MNGEKDCLLVVDDSPINLSSIEQRLKDKYNIVPVNSGNRALRYLKENKPDLILLDIKMAEKDGIETLKEIRAMEECADIPVIMLTASNDKRSIVESQKLGIYDYVLKPFDTDNIHERIQRALEKAREAKHGDGDGDDDDYSMLNLLH